MTALRVTRQARKLLVWQHQQMLWGAREIKGKSWQQSGNGKKRSNFLCWARTLEEDSGKCFRYDKADYMMTDCKISAPVRCNSCRNTDQPVTDELRPYENTTTRANPQDLWTPNTRIQRNQESTRSLGPLPPPNEGNYAVVTPCTVSSIYRYPNTELSAMAEKQGAWLKSSTALTSTGVDSWTSCRNWGTSPCSTTACTQNNTS